MADGLKGFDPQATRVSQPPATTAPAIQESAQQLQDVTSRLKSFSQTMFQKQAEVVADKAKDRALKDAAEGVPFHKEEVYTVYGKAYNNTLSATYAAQGEIALSKKAQELALIHQNNPVGFSKAMGSYLEGVTKTAPTPALKTSLGIYGEKLKNKAFGSLSIAQNNRIKAEQKEIFLQSWGKDIGQTIDAIHSGDTASADILIQKNKAHLESLRNTGSISPAEALRLNKNATYQITYGTSMLKMGQMLDEGDIDGATAYLEEQTATNRPDMDIPENKKHKADLNRMMNSYITKQKAAKTAMQSQANSILSDAGSILDAGKTPDNMQEVEEAYALASEAKKREFDKKTAVAEIYNKHLDGLSLPDQEDMYNTLESQEEISIEQLGVLKMLGKNLKDRRTKADSDVVGLAIQEGVIDAPLAMSADDGIDGLLNGLNQMEQTTHLIKTKYGEDKTNLMSKDDANSWSNYMNSPNVPVQDKIDVVEAIITQHPNIAHNVFDQIGGKNSPTFGYAATLALAGNKEAARVAMLGKGAKVDVPSGYTNLVKAKLGNTFGGYPAHVHNRYIEGSIDYAKGLALEGEAIDDSDSGINAMLEKSIGIVTNYNGKDTILPQGVTQSEFEFWLDNIEIPGQPELQEEVRSMSTDILDWYGGDLQLMFRAPGEYMIRSKNNGNPIIHMDEEGKPFILKFPKVK